MGGHVVQFYEREAFLVDAVSGFIGGGLEADEAGVVIACPSVRKAVERRLRAQGLDLRAARDHGRYLPLDAAATLAKLLVDDRPDAARFADVVGGAIARAADGGGRRVRAFGEMVALLWAAEEARAALRLEELWNDLGREIPFSLLCAYPIGVFRGEATGQPLLEICGAHSHVLPTESHPGTDDPDQRRSVIMALQRQARGLAELAAGKALQRSSGRRQRYLAERAEERVWLAAIVESSDDAIVGKTLDGTVTSWNRAAERIFGYTAEEMIGQPIARLIPPERADDLTAILGAIRRGECVEHFETERMCKDGRRVQVSLSVSPIRDARGRVIGASKIARDVTARKQLESEREALLAIAEQERARAETADRAKDEFLAMLGHELRNPLAALRNAVVTAGLDESRRDRALTIARRQTEQLARLVDDLLDVARITRGHVQIRRERVTLTAIIERALEATAPFIEEFGHELSLSLPTDDVHLEADSTRLEQVVVNLLGNAAKYTPAGGRIELVAERRGEAAVVTVRDSGTGIGAEMLPRVFDLFAQSDRSLNRPQGGLGIGLTIARRLVELHGGRIEARSAGLGKGAEFIVHLPALPATRAPEGLVASPLVAVRPGRTRVLLVEDNPDAAESLQMLLEVLGHRVRVVHDGLAAIETAAANLPDVMLIDIGLPGMDGYEVARHIRELPALKQVVLVALTGYGRDEDRERALTAGFDYHLVKPVDPRALQGLVARFEKGHGEGKEPSTVH